MHQVYEDEMTFKLVGAASQVSGLPVDVCLEEFGKHFLVYCQKNGYDQILRVLGSNLFDFLTNLDNLHDHLASIYPGMRAPSFRVTRHLYGPGDVSIAETEANRRSSTGSDDLEQKSTSSSASISSSCQSYLADQTTLIINADCESRCEKRQEEKDKASSSGGKLIEDSQTQSMYLHYYSERAGLSPIVKGLVLAVAREFFQTDITVTECHNNNNNKHSGDSDHVVFKIDRKRTSNVDNESEVATQNTGPNDADNRDGNDNIDREKCLEIRASEPDENDRVVVDGTESTQSTRSTGTLHRQLRADNGTLSNDSNSTSASNSIQETARISQSQLMTHQQQKHQLEEEQKRLQLTNSEHHQHQPHSHHHHNRSPLMLNIYNSLSSNESDSLINSEIMMVAFPFHVIFDRQFGIVQVGQSLLKATSQFWQRHQASETGSRIGALKFSDLFFIQRPKIDFTFEAIAGHTNQVFVVKTRPNVLNNNQNNYQHQPNCYATSSSQSPLGSAKSLFPNQPSQIPFNSGQSSSSANESTGQKQSISTSTSPATGSQHPRRQSELDDHHQQPRCPFDAIARAKLQQHFQFQPETTNQMEPSQTSASASGELAGPAHPTTTSPPVMHPSIMNAAVRQQLQQQNNNNINNNNSSGNNGTDLSPCSQTRSAPGEGASLRLKGQMIVLMGGQLCLFLCSPRVDHLDQLWDCGIRMSHFALHDRARELMLISHTHKGDRDKVKKLDQATNDLKKMDAKLRAENKRTNEVLHNIFPAKIATLLSHGHKVESESFEMVTCLYSDIIGFTRMCGSENVRPIDIVVLLNTLYLQFDSLTNIHGVFKVETIGDAYVVVGGLPEPAQNHADRCLRMGLDMVQVIATVRSPADGQPIQMRIGIHSGPVMAGIVGVRVPRYSLFGNTTTLANQLETNGVGGKIHISDFTLKSLINKNKFIVEENARQDLNFPFRTHFVTGYHFEDQDELIRHKQLLHDQLVKDFKLMGRDELQLVDSSYHLYSTESLRRDSTRETNRQTPTIDNNHQLASGETPSPINNYPRSPNLQDHNNKSLRQVSGSLGPEVRASGQVLDETSTQTSCVISNLGKTSQFSELAEVNKKVTLGEFYCNLTKKTSRTRDRQDTREYHREVDYSGNEHGQIGARVSARDQTSLYESSETAIHANDEEQTEGDEEDSDDLSLIMDIEDLVDEKSDSDSELTLGRQSEPAAEIRQQQEQEVHEQEPKGTDSDIDGVGQLGQRLSKIIINDAIKASAGAPGGGMKWRKMDKPGELSFVNELTELFVRRRLQDNETTPASTKINPSTSGLGVGNNGRANNGTIPGVSKSCSTKATISLELEPEEREKMLTLLTSQALDSTFTKLEFTLESPTKIRLRDAKMDPDSAVVPERPDAAEHGASSAVSEQLANRIGDEAITSNSGKQQQAGKKGKISRSVGTNIKDWEQLKSTLSILQDQLECADKCVLVSRSAKHSEINTESGELIRSALRSIYKNLLESGDVQAPEAGSSDAIATGDNDQPASKAANERAVSTDTTVVECYDKLLRDLKEERSKIEQLFERFKQSVPVFTNPGNNFLVLPGKNCQQTFVANAPPASDLIPKDIGHGCGPVLQASQSSQARGQVVPIYGPATIQQQYNHGLGCRAMVQQQHLLQQHLLQHQLQQQQHLHQHQLHEHPCVTIPSVAQVIPVQHGAPLKHGPLSRLLNVSSAPLSSSVQRIKRMDTLKRRKATNEAAAASSNAQQTFCQPTTRLACGSNFAPPPSEQRGQRIIENSVFLEEEPGTSAAGHLYGAHSDRNSGAASISSSDNNNNARNNVHRASVISEETPRCSEGVDKAPRRASQDIIKTLTSNLAWVASMRAQAGHSRTQKMAEHPLSPDLTTATSTPTKNYKRRESELANCYSSTSGSQWNKRLSVISNKIFSPFSSPVHRAGVSSERGGGAKKKQQSADKSEKKKSSSRKTTMKTLSSKKGSKAKSNDYDDDESGEVGYDDDDDDENNEELACRSAIHASFDDEDDDDEDDDESHACDQLVETRPSVSGQQHEMDNKSRSAVDNRSSIDTNQADAGNNNNDKGSSTFNKKQTISNESNNKKSSTTSRGSTSNNLVHKSSGCSCFRSSSSLQSIESPKNRDV